jgi:predicted RNase H-like HicB family nuclease
MERGGAKLNKTTVGTQKSFRYPIVFILNRETNMYNGFIPDLCLACEGATMDAVIIEAQSLLARFFEIATKYDTEIPKESSLESTYEKWPGYKVMYVAVQG